MKLNFILILFSTFFSLFLFAQKEADFEGVYRAEFDGKTHVLLAVDGYVSMTSFQQEKFGSTFGGTFSWDGKSLEILEEFNTENPQNVGEKTVLQFEKSGKNILDKEGQKWKSVQNSDFGLDGAWKITGRKVEGEMRTIQHQGGRKTVKLLQDGYFQWAAIDTEKKELYGTGGGIYTFENNVYTEKIEFFSKDNSRVGAKLEFKGEIKNGDWHHSGLSSKGAEIYEIWERE